MLSLPFEVGVISDTHRLLRPEAVLALEGCQVIFHAGDIGSPSIISELESIAPCYAVSGNCDDNIDFPLVVCREIQGLRILMYHGHHPILESDYCPNLVITGHTHIPEIIQEREVLRLNPGSAGPRRFRQPVTLARLKIIERRVEAQIIHLPVG